MSKPTSIALCLAVLAFMGGCAFSDDDLGDEPDEETTEVSEDALSSDCAPIRKLKLSLPRKKDIVFSGRACLQYSKDGRKVRSRIFFAWEPAGGLGLSVGKKLDRLELRAYLGEHVDGDADPGPGDEVVCDRTKMVNDAASGSTSCSTAWYWRRARPWAALNEVDYDVNDDGKGGKFWPVKFFSR